MIERKCENCKWFGMLSHNFEVGKGFSKDYCCTLYVEGEKPWIVQVDPNSFCEVFSEKKEGED